MTQLNIKNLIANVKELLRKREMTYSDLAKEIGMSESGVQKVFSGDDISMSRLLQICDAVGVSLGAIVDQAETLTSNEINFDSEQEKFFLDNPNFFDFYWALSSNQFNPAVVQEKYGLDDLSLQKYLLKLDKLGVIELHENNRIKFEKVNASYWLNESHLAKKMIGRYQVEFVKDSLRREQGCYNSMFEVPMTPELQKELFNALQELYKKYFEKASKELHIIGKNKTNRVCTTITVGVNQEDYLNIPNL